MWWQVFLWGLWNGLTAWVILLAHALGQWQRFPLFNVARSGNWYDFGFLIGAGSPFFGISGKGRKRS